MTLKVFLEGTKVLETNENCVPNVKLEVRLNKKKTNNQYSNLHARKRESHLASLGMRDTYLFISGNVRSGFTRESKTIATRTD